MLTADFEVVVEFRCGPPEGGELRPRDVREVVVLVVVANVERQPIQGAVVGISLLG